jgi:acetate kinase
MIVLVANLGSTSFKYKLFDMSGSERVLAEGAADRIGQSASAWSIAPATGARREGTASLPDHGAAIELHLAELTRMGVIRSIDAVEAIGFKAVHGGPISGAVVVDEQVLAVQQQFADVAPAHNPPYIAAMKAFAQRLPGVPQVAAFETAFHQTIPAKRTTYAIPYEWTRDLGIRRYGFHGASHRYIATRMAELDGAARRVISIHLGGSCSVCAIRDGASVANSFGMTVQTGVPHASRVGDFDAFAILKLQAAGVDLATVWKRLGKEGGLAGIGGMGPDLRDIEKAAEQGHERARLAIDVFVESVRDYLGAYLGVLHGVDAVVFTGGIGQNSRLIRRRVIEGFEFAGLSLDEAKNESTGGKDEKRIDAGGTAQVWVMPTNEEWIVARQTVAALKQAKQADGKTTLVSGV